MKYLLSLPLLGLLVILAFYPIFGNTFTNWDDHVYLTGNELIRKMTWSNIKVIFSTFLMGNYHPLVPFSYMIEYSLWGLAPKGYFVVNLGIHLANTLGIAFILRKWPGISPSAAWVGAALFGLHPLHVESVAWVSERKDVLYTFFFLGATLSWQYWRLVNNKRYYILSILLFILACLSKGMAVVWPFWILLTDLLLRPWPRKVSILWHLPGLAIGLGFGILAIYAQQTQGAVRPDDVFLFPDNILVAAWGHLFYLWKCIWPYPLSAFYPYPLPPRSFPLNYWFAPVIILALLGYSVYLFGIKKYPQLLYSFLSYGIILFPVSQILPVGSAVTADRYFYLSSIGICFLLAWGYTYFEKWNLKIAQISMLMIALLWTGLSNQRSRVWHDTVTLFKDVIQHYPQVPVAYNNIGNVYEQQKNYTEAVQWYRKSVEVQTTYKEGLINMGVIYERLKQPDSSLYYYRIARDIYPTDARMPEMLANATNKYGNWLREQQNVIGAEQAYRESLTWLNTYPEAWNNLGNTFFSQGKVDSAIICIQTALRYKPEYAEAWGNLGSIYGSAQQLDSAIYCFQKSVQYKPDYSGAWFNLGYALQIKGDPTAARSAFETAARLGHPGAQELLNRLSGKQP
ncbi:MAG: tetratricopeptide repeat protein [Sphingobacteriia bacterium]|nr:tetratricopeptide repeat protein [Sphingobacteriia bacterium]